MIVITQTCDACGESRTLNVGYYGGRRTIQAAAEVSGWRAVQEFKHMCANCIGKVLQK